MFEVIAGISWKLSGIQSLNKIYLCPFLTHLQSTWNSGGL